MCVELGGSTRWLERSHANTLGNRAVSIDPAIPMTGEPQLHETCSAVEGLQELRRGAARIVQLVPRQHLDRSYRSLTVNRSSVHVK